MACLCPAQLASLLKALPAIPTGANLVPAIPVSLLAALMPPSPLTASASATASESAIATASAQASLMANLAAMASFSAAARAAFGVTANASMSATAMASMQASLTANVQSLNAVGPLLQQLMAALASLLNSLLPLSQLLGLLAAAQARFGIDGKAHFTHVNAGTGKAQWPFDTPQFLILNIAVGGDFGGDVDDTIFPVRMEIDHVRVYQKVR